MPQEKRGLEEEEVGGASVEGAVKRVCAEPENGRPGDWLCPECNHHNWSFRDTCQKCQTSKDGTKAAVGDVPSGGRPGDWNCPMCQHNNYAFRNACQRCFTPKPPMGAAAGAPGSATSRPGDWNCPNCNDLVYASRFACRKCNTPKPPAAMMGMGGGGYVTHQTGYDANAMANMYGAYASPYGQAPAAMPPAQSMPKESRPGDWSCPKCFDVNYASRTACRLCHTPKSADPAEAAANQYMQQMYGAAYGGYGGGFTMGVPPAGGGGSRRSGDWDCPNCGDLVYATRSECRKCQTSKPANLGDAAARPYQKPMNNGLGPSRRAGDWDCAACGDVQYASRTECRKCRAAKPM